MHRLKVVGFTAIAACIVLGVGAKARDNCYAGVEETAGMEDINEDQNWSGLNGDCVSWVQTEEGFGCNFFRGDMDYAAEYRVGALDCSAACHTQCGNDYVPASAHPTSIEVVESWTQGEIADGDGTFFAHAMGVCVCETDGGGGPPMSAGGRQRLGDQQPEIVYLSRPGFPKSVRENGELRPIFSREQMISVTGKVRNFGNYVLPSADWVTLDLLLQRADLLPDADYIDVVGQFEPVGGGHVVTSRRGMSRELLTVASSMLPQRVPRVYPGDRVIVR